MSLVKSASVLLSALLSQSCTQAYPSEYQWERIQNIPFADVASLSPLTDYFSPKSDSTAERLAPSTNDFDESDMNNREFLMIPKSYSEAPRKHFDVEYFLKHHPHIKPGHSTRHRPAFEIRPFVGPISELSSGSSGIGQLGSSVADEIFSGLKNFIGNVKFTQPELFDTSKTHQYEYESETSEKRHITREDLLSELHAIKEALQNLKSAVIRVENEISFNKEGVTYPSVAISPQPLVLINPNGASEQGPIEAITEEAVTHPTVTNSSQPPVLINPNGASEQGPIEANNEEGVTYPSDTTPSQTFF
uniref:CrV1 protein n=2 Tax=root TaxID=1 RepID=Q66223_9VIRU|nr:CrV1 protein [Bracoviriform rubeculae]